MHSYTRADRVHVLTHSAKTCAGCVHLHTNKNTHAQAMGCDVLIRLVGWHQPPPTADLAHPPLCFGDDSTPRSTTQWRRAARMGPLRSGTRTASRASRRLNASQCAAPSPVASSLPTAPCSRTRRATTGTRAPTKSSRPRSQTAFESTGRFSGMPGQTSVCLSAKSRMQCYRAMKKNVCQSAS
jgi:hypothetical protein